MFVGRTRELQDLARFLAREKPGIAVVYGRRRIGKTEFVTQAVAERPALFFDGLENRPKAEQIDNFVFQAKIQGLSLAVPKGTTRWREVFHELHLATRAAPRVIVLDEFQWMANYRREIVADLKLIWDRFFSKTPGASLVLCGSIASFMVSRVVRSTALYGRADLVIHLKPFSLGEAASMLPGRGWREVLDAQMLVGGVPQYLELLSHGPSVRLALAHLAFAENGYFVEEFERIFTSHFGSNPDFEAIVRALARHQHGLFRSELIEAVGVEAGGTLSRHLGDLEAAGFLDSLRPVDRGDRKGRLVKYALADAYLRFYFAFVEPNLNRIGTVSDEQLFDRISQTGAFHAWMGLAFEEVCRQHASRISELLGFSGIDFRCGPYLRPGRGGAPGVQIDLVFVRADRVVTLCEMNYSQQPVGIDVTREVEARAEKLRDVFPGCTVQKVLALAGDVTRDLAASRYLYRIIRAESLLGI